MRQQGIIGRGVHAGMCRAWPLPADETCAGTARRLFRGAVTQLGLERDVLEEAVLMTSELAANTMHAATATRTGLLEVADPLVTGHAEMWLYLRGLGLKRELVCKVFDCYRGWLHGPPLVPGPMPGHRASGRGLLIVHELSGGRWGHHPTWARLGECALRGKAVWFAVSAPFAHARLADVTGLRAYTRSADVSAARRHERISPRQAARELEAMLDKRGFGRSGAGLVRSDDPAGEMSVLAFNRGLTLRCRSGAVSLTGPGGYRERWSYADLVEAAEETIRCYEELDPDQPRFRVVRDAYVTA